MGALPEAVPNRRILCLDDDPTVLALCKAALTRAGYEVETVYNGWEALQRLNQRRYDAVLLDLFMPLLHGRTVISLMQQTHPEVLQRTIVMTGMNDDTVSELQGKIGGILRKPLKIDSLVDFVRDFA